MNEPAAVEFRLERLEQDNRRLNLTVGALLLVMAGAACAGAMMPEQIPQVIEAREFRMIDANGTVLIAINDEGFSYFDEIGRVSTGFSHGEILASMSTESSDVIDARMFRVVDENGVVRALMNADSIGYFDENGNVVWGMPER